MSDGKGRIFINIEDKNAIDVVDTKTWKVVATWRSTACDGPTGIAMDRATNRIFSGCSKKSVVVDATTGKVVAEIANGDGVDALGWDQSQKLMYIPAGRSGNVTVVHEDSPGQVHASSRRCRRWRREDGRRRRREAHRVRVHAGVRTGARLRQRRVAVAGRGPVTAAWLLVIKR